MNSRYYPVRPLSAVIAGFTAGVSVNSEDRAPVAGEHGVLKVSAVGMGRFFPEESKAVLSRELERVGPSVRSGDVLVTRANTLDLVGAATLVEDDYPSLHLSDKTWRAECHDTDRDTLRWLPHLLNCPTVREQLQRRATGTSGSMKNIGQRSYLGIQVPIAPQYVRGTIAGIAEAVSTAVDRARSLALAKRRFRRGLMQRLYSRTNDVRSGAAVSRRTMPLSVALTESRELASTGQHARKLTIKLYGKGLVAKRDLRPGSAQTQYYRRAAGQFIYSKLDFLNGAFGIVPPELDGYESTLDLPAFDVSDSVNPQWLLHLFSWPGFYKRHVGLANGGRKARRVNPSQLLRLEIEFPPREAQDCIASLLGALDNELDLLDNLAAALDRQKRALLERLLSGEIQVSVP